MEEIHVTDDGSLHKYRTEIPNTVVNGYRSRDLSVYAKWLYVYLKRVAGDKGQCTQGTTTLMRGAGFSRGQIVKARQELQRSGLIRVSAGTRKNRDTLTMHITDIWLENMQEFGGGAWVFIIRTPGKKGKSRREKAARIPVFI